MLHDKDSNHYEFIIADDSVVRLSIYSNSYWNNTGERFSISGEKKDICEDFNITLGDNVKKVRHTFETGLDNAGGNRKCIDMLMGHKSKDVGNRVYNHKTIDQLRDTVNLLK